MVPSLFLLIWHIPVLDFVVEGHNSSFFWCGLFSFDSITTGIKIHLQCLQLHFFAAIDACCIQVVSEGIIEIFGLYSTLPYGCKIIAGIVLSDLEPTFSDARMNKRASWNSGVDFCKKGSTVCSFKEIFSAEADSTDNEPFPRKWESPGRAYSALKILVLKPSHTRGYKIDKTSFLKFIPGKPECRILMPECSSPHAKDTS